MSIVCNGSPAIVERRRGAYALSTDVARLDLDAVHAYLTRSYWSPGVPRALVARAAHHSLCIGLYHDGDGQVGFARAVTDRATYAYLADVYVLEAHRGARLGQWMIGTLLAHDDLQGLRRLALRTRDAHGLYAKFGFAVGGQPDRYMERVRPASYATDVPNDGAPT